MSGPQLRIAAACVALTAGVVAVVVVVLLMHAVLA
jgi:hypothetical protein